MTQDEMQQAMTEIFKQCQVTREAGQKEYAGGEDAFGNFNRLAKLLDTDRKKILLVYSMKHMDGIFAFVNGHKSQREDVRGRIKDMIVYLCLLWGMINEDEGIKVDEAGMFYKDRTGQVTADTILIGRKDPEPNEPMRSCFKMEE